ncbi:MAG: BCD family MFS transporter [Anaerolineae bacterium]|nr:BCD family MFS transporter [Anaerolineae bacterium]
MKTVFHILNLIRLALFPIGYGLLGALVGGTLNRILIADLSMPASLVGFFFAIPLLVSPTRVWLGYRSDGFPIFGLRREPYMLAGILVAGIGVITIVLVTVNIAQTTFALVLGGLFAFLLYGLGRNLGHNTFQALLADKFTGDQRPRAVTAYEVATLLGLVMGAGGLGKALETFDPARLISVAIGVAVVALILTALAALGNEPRTQVVREATEKAREVPFQKVLKTVLVADPQIRLFFILVLLTFVGTLAQDVLLEPYGALVLNMEVGDTTRLTMFWGLGVMGAMLLSGLVLIKFLGYMNVLRIGLVSSILVFAGVIISGIGGNTGLFQTLVLFMGLGTGMAGAGMLTGAINFTTTIRAGMLMGVWGMANMVGHAFGSLMGAA